LFLNDLARNIIFALPDNIWHLKLVPDCRLVEVHVLPVAQEHSPFFILTLQYFFSLT